MLLSLFCIAGISVWLINEDFPEPETPVTATILFRGMSVETLFKLFVSAPEI